MELLILFVCIIAGWIIARPVIKLLREFGY